MNHRDARALLQQVIADIDEGRLAVVPPPRSIGRHVGGSLLAAALGLSASACDSGKSSDGNRAQPPVQEPVETAVSLYAVTEPTVTPSAAAYAVEVPQPAYLAPDTAEPATDGGAPDAGKSKGETKAQPSTGSGRRMNMPRPMYMAPPPDRP